MVEDKCTCDIDGHELHSCPYQEEINENDDPAHCTCCSECEYQCSQDI